LEMVEFYKRTGLNPVFSYAPLLGQGLVFCSMFFAIRGMAAAPVESMSWQGMAWFTDLTAQDPIFLLPVLTSASLLLHLKLGADGLNPQQVAPMMRNFLFVMPIIGLPIMCQFPAALNLYWLTTNIVSIGLTRLIWLPTLRARFGINEMIQWTPEDLPLNQIGSNPFTAISQAVKKADEESKSAKDGKGKQASDLQIDLTVIEARIRREIRKEMEEKLKKVEAEKEDKRK